MKKYANIVLGIIAGASLCGAVIAKGILFFILWIILGAAVIALMELNGKNVTRY